MNFDEFSGFVLAGGKSSRMKTDKAFLKIAGETLLEKAFKTLAALAKNTKIVIDKNQKAKFEKAFPAFDFIFDIYRERGALGGIHAALKNCETEFAFLLAVDLPRVTPATLEHLAAASNDSAATVPRQNDGRLQPLCAVYRAKDCLPALEELLERDRSASVRDFLKLISVNVVEANLPGAGEDVFLNVNRPEDLSSLTG
jgi:molybdenum cofactor guanylyltransferase